MKQYPDSTADLIVALDVIEHLPLHEMLSILDELLYSCDLLLIAWPSKHPQSAGANLYDKHRCSPELSDFVPRFDIVHYSKTGFAQIHSVHRYHLMLIRGHMNLKVYPPFI